MTAVRPSKIVLTGAPGSGKTTIAAALVAARPDRFHLVTEAATHVYAAQNTRWHDLTTHKRRRTQSAMYAHQIEQERVAEQALATDDADRRKVILLDRGTIDGSAYWPDGPDAFWRGVGTTRDAELTRYDAVILLETAAAVGRYDGQASNPVRFEDADAAIANGRLLARLWGDHPRLTFVPAFARYADKYAAVAAAVDAAVNTVAATVHAAARRSAVATCVPRG